MISKTLLANLGLTILIAGVGCCLDDWFERRVIRRWKSLQWRNRPAKYLGLGVVRGKSITIMKVGKKVTGSVLVVQNDILC